MLTKFIKTNNNQMFSFGKTGKALANIIKLIPITNTVKIMLNVILAHAIFDVFEGAVFNKINSYPSVVIAVADAVFELVTIIKDINHLIPWDNDFSFNIDLIFHNLKGKRIINSKFL